MDKCSGVEIYYARFDSRASEASTTLLTIARKFKPSIGVANFDRLFGFGRRRLRIIHGVLGITTRSCLRS